MCLYLCVSCLGRENVIENQIAQMEEMERMTEACRDQLRRKEREYEESLLQLRGQQTSGQRYVTFGFIHVFTS